MSGDCRRLRSREKCEFSGAWAISEGGTVWGTVVDIAMGTGRAIDDLSPSIFAFYADIFGIGGKSSRFALINRIIFGIGVEVDRPVRDDDGGEFADIVEVNIARSDDFDHREGWDGVVASDGDGGFGIKSTGRVVEDVVDDGAIGAWVGIDEG